MKITPAGEFEKWLPGELVYSVRKAGYNTKIGRASLPVSDRRSMYGFLGAEWHNHQLMRRAGNHHADEHQITAQLQLAKFASGLFDKAALAVWMISGAEPSEDRMVAAAEETAFQIVRIQPWEKQRDEDPEKILECDFEETPFAPAIEEAMQVIGRTADLEVTSVRKEAPQLFKSMLTVGGLATSCYFQYAQDCLTEDELRLPPSQLVG